MDHFVKERLHIKCYVRYMDDFILIHESKTHLQHCRTEIAQFLEQRKLSLNHKTALFPLSQGITFLQWRYQLTSTGRVVKTIPKSRLRRQRSHIKKLARIGLPKDYFDKCIRSMLACCAHGNTETIRRNMLKYAKEIYEYERKRHDASVKV